MDPPDSPQEPPPEEPTMEIHKPKPVHSWREFLKEYAIIVLGVLTALALEQTVEWLHWRSQVDQARSLIASELAQGVAHAMWRTRTEKCAERRLDELGAILDAASKTGVLPPVGDIGTPVASLSGSSAWDSAQASQAAVHFPSQELARLTIIYREVQRADGVNDAEHAEWNALYAMVGPGRRLDPASEARLRDALSQARYINRQIVLISENLVRQVKGLNLPFSSDDLKWIARGEREPLVHSRNDFSWTGYLCSPIGEVPSVYGQAGFQFIPYHVDESLKAPSRLSNVGH